MKKLTLSLCLLLIVCAAPAFASTIPVLLNPLPLNAPGTFNLYPANNSIIASGQSTGCFQPNGLCQDFYLGALWNSGHLSSDVLSGTIDLSSTSAAEFEGNVFDTSFNSKTGDLTGLFNGWELVSSNNATAFYRVKGTFSLVLDFSSTTSGTLGGGSVNITSSTYVGPNFVPEPGTLSMIGTGLFGIVAMLRRRLARP